MKQKIGIIAAADDEIQPLIAQMRIEKTEEAAMLKLIEGTWQGQSITAVRCGVGKVNAALACLLYTSQTSALSKSPSRLIRPAIWSKEASELSSRNPIRKDNQLPLLYTKSLPMSSRNQLYFPVLALLFSTWLPDLLISTI